MLKKYICLDCGHIGSAKNRKRGSVFMTIFLLCLFIFPGILYILYRMFGKTKRCRSCNSARIIPSDSPKGLEILNNQTR